MNWLWIVLNCQHCLGGSIVRDKVVRGCTNDTIWGKRTLWVVAGIICQVCSNQSGHMMAHASPLCQPLFWIGSRLIQTFASPSKVSSQIEMPSVSFVLRSPTPPKSPPQKKENTSHNFPPKGQLQQGLLGISGMSQRQYLSFRSLHQTLWGRIHEYLILVLLLLVHHLCRSLKARDWKTKQIKTDPTRIYKAQQPPPVSHWVVNVN